VVNRKEYSKRYYRENKEKILKMMRDNRIKNKKELLNMPDEEFLELYVR
jgi:hypothetical protein